MLSLFVLFLLYFCVTKLECSSEEQKLPNIVFVMFDDLGWQDLSYNGGEIPTPNMDSLMAESINLQKHYIHLICSISRSQFLTGRYAMYSGYGRMSPFGVGHVGGIPIGQPTFAQWLKSYNSEYTTYGVGKWVMGYSTEESLPMRRGFDHWFGTYTAAIDYSNGKISANKCDGCNPDRYDMHDDGKDYSIIYENTIFDFRDKMVEYVQREINKNKNNDFSSPFYMYFPIQTPHGPLKYIKEYMSQCREIIGDMEGTDDDIRSHRLKYCEAIVASDDIIGRVITKLKSYSEIWDNTIFVLTTDNGGDIENTGCNYPLRGTKGTWFEGNQRSIALIGGGKIPKQQYGTIRNSLFSALDWTPTLLQFIGIYDKIDEKDRMWDGINQYNLIMNGDDYKDRIDRDHIVFNIGYKDLLAATVIFKYPDDNNKLYKYLAQEKQMTLRLDGWCNPDKETGSWSVIADNLEIHPELAPETQGLDNKFIFNLEDDLSEMNNLLISDPDSDKTANLKQYAFDIFNKYMEHPLFSEALHGLWKYDQEEDDEPDLNNEGKEYLHPWLNHEEYLEIVNFMMDKETKKGNIIPDELRKLYNERWESPFDKKQEETINAHVKGHTEQQNNEDTVSIPTSCIGLEDGEYIMKLIEDDKFHKYPLINVKCSNEYMLIDYKSDNNWSSYFSSWIKWHYDIAGPDKNDRVNTNQWFLPAPHNPKDTKCLMFNAHDLKMDPDYFATYAFNGYRSATYPTKYIVSPECDICFEGGDHSETNLFLDKTAYYMNPAAWGVFFGLRRPACDFDWDTYQCKLCDHTEGHMYGFPRPSYITMEGTIQNNRSQSNTMFGVCLTEPRSAFQCTTKDFYEFTGYGYYNYKPSIGTNGRFCQCAKILEPKVSSIQVSKSQYDEKVKEINKPQPQEKDDGPVTIELYQKDFELGTYRITKSGQYKIMEDIVFNFNAAPKDAESPNDPDLDYWWPPTKDNPEFLEKYPGSGYKAREPYQLGYFAGITIETNDVTLDLNGFTIKQSRDFYYQQPFFAAISLYSQPFLPNQGPGFFGAEPHFGSNIIIKNGVIGRSSHHGIQGAKNKNVRIENIHIRDFMTHGIQINGFDGLHLENVEIGPTSTDNWLNHNYAHLRMLLPYFYKMANYDSYHMEEKISFDPAKRDDNGREYTLNDLVDIAVEKLDKVYKYVMSDEFDENKLSELVKTDGDFELFINTDGLPYGAVVYGMYLNYPGSGIFGWDVSDLRPNNLYMKNIKIHDLYHSGNEVFGLSKNKKRFVVNTLLAPINMIHLFGDIDTLKEWIDVSYNDVKNDNVIYPNYVGNIALDLYFATYKIGSDRFDEWWLGVPYMGQGVGGMIDWVLGNDPSSLSTKMGGSHWEPVCSMDGMSHPGKGILAIKLSNADNVVIDGGLDIYNLFDYTPLAMDGICITNSNTYGAGDSQPKVVSSEQSPYQTAFSMNQIYAISAELSDITINENAQININNLQSHTGRILGFIAWYSTKINMNGKNINININDLFAGIDVERGMFQYIDQPNHKPEVCSFALYNGHHDYTSPKIQLNDDTNIDQFCIHGHIGCWGKTDFTNLDNINEDKSCISKGSNKLEFQFKQLYKQQHPIHLYSLTAISITATTIIIAAIITYYYKIKNDFKYTPIP